MKARCYRKSHKNYKDYGARGIIVYDGWITDFQSFYEYVGEPPCPDWTLDRIDPDGDYEPGNVRWAPEIVQVINQRRHLPVLEEGCRLLGINLDDLFSALINGAQDASL